MERSLILHGGPLIPSPTLHGALAANGLKGAISFKYVGAMRPRIFRRQLRTIRVRACPMFRLNTQTLRVSHLVTFSSTNPPLARALAERNYDRLTPVQTAVLADDAAGR